MTTGMFRVGYLKSLLKIIFKNTDYTIRVRTRFLFRVGDSLYNTSILDNIDKYQNGPSHVSSIKISSILTTSSSGNLYKKKGLPLLSQYWNLPIGCCFHIIILLESQKDGKSMVRVVSTKKDDDKGSLRLPLPFLSIKLRQYQLSPTSSFNLLFIEKGLLVTGIFSDRLIPIPGWGVRQKHPGVWFSTKM